MAAAAALLVALLAATAARGAPQNNEDNMAARLEEAGRAVSAWTPSSGVSPWELSQLEEGDIMQTVVAVETLKWQNRSMPYFVEETHFDDEEREKINAVARELNELSCLHVFHLDRWVGNDWVRIVGNDTGCWSERVGRKGGEQLINLQSPNCLEPGTIAHEFMHAMGFHHTHNSPHRDDHIIINWENVINGQKNTFFKKHGEEATDIGVWYDYNSIMHGSRKAQSSNGKDTIDTHDPTVVIGFKAKPSVGDIFQLNKLYECPYDVDDDDEDYED